ncbi:hypothetical protein RHSIM_Rhsim03G0182300 [Rhododendron simsii]|uniref:Uncharacterized protein n=1 Tax=Rhododendron simsii TaxID=118357 RepID=A0A834HAQ0_RHOSS|nr:hypothetical protein RHSIM_Rhsim03G0182300 [Rhododendron simsii]
MQLWAYEVLGMFPPENTCKDPNLFPRGLVWNKEYRKTKERGGEVMTFRRWLDNLIGVSRTDTYTRAELEQFTVPNTNLEGFLRRTMDYDAYKERYLAMSLGVEQELQRRVAETEARRAASGTRAEIGGDGDRGGHSQRARGRGRGTSLRGRGRGSMEASASGEDVPEAHGLPELKWEISVRDHTGARAIVDIPRLPHPAMNIPELVSREWAESAIMRMLGMRKLLHDCARGKMLQTRPIVEPAVTPAAESPQVQLNKHMFKNSIIQNMLMLCGCRCKWPETRRRTRAQSQAATGSLMPRVAQTEGRQFELRARPEVQRQPEPEEPEESEKTERSEESLGASDSDTDSGLPDPSDSDNVNDDDDSSGEDDPPQKRSRRV